MFFLHLKKNSGHADVLLNELLATCTEEHLHIYSVTPWLKLKKRFGPKTYASPGCIQDILELSVAKCPPLHDTDCQLRPDRGPWRYILPAKFPRSPPQKTWEKTKFVGLVRVRSNLFFFSMQNMEQ